MELFKFGGDFNKLKIGYQLDEITANRLDIGLVDWYALDKLTNLVSGGISGTQDLFAAEMALRAIVFHDGVEEIQPSYKVQVINPGQSPFVYSDSPTTQPRQALQDALISSNHRVRLCGVEQLIKFAEHVDVNEYINAHEKNRQHILKEQREWYKKIGIPEPALDLDTRTAPLEAVAASKDDFFDGVFSCDDKYLTRLLSPLSASGYAAYLGHPAINQRYEHIRNYNASQFFSVLDESWAQHHKYLRRRLNIPIPLFLSIILSRASDRNSIPKEISYLKQEFSDARSQLWDLFDEADFRIFDTSVAARNLRDIEHAAASVIPRALKAREFSFPIRFDWLGRAMELENLGIIKVMDFIGGALANQCIRVDAANLTQKHIQSIELRGLIEKFLTDEELLRLNDSPL